MRTSTPMILASLVALIALPAASAGSTEIFGGYTLTRVKPAGSGDVTLNGWAVSITNYPWTRLGITADFAGYYGKVYPDTGGGVSKQQHSFMAGPQVRLFRKEGLEVSVRALIGGAHGQALLPGTTGGDETAVASLFGSNFDVKVSRNMALRFSPGIYLTDFVSGQRQTSFRISIGPVFRFGRGEE